MKFRGFVGPTYKLNSVNVDAQRCVNLYPELVESGTGKEGEIAYLKSTPGLRKIADVGTGPIRMVYVDDVGSILVASGSKMYSLYFDVPTSAWITTEVGNLESASGRIYAASYSTDSIYYYTAFVDGANSYAYYTNSITPGSFGTFASYGYIAVLLSTQLAVIDGYFVFVFPSSNKFFVSDLNSLFVSPLSFASSEGNIDRINAVIVNGRDLWIFNERSTEIYTNTGNADFPFERIQGGYFEKGCLAPNSPANIEAMVLWLGRDPHGQGVVYAAQGVTPQRISTHAVEQSISAYANPEKATSYAYQKNGHSFYVLNFAEATWVYDLSTKLWHERAYTNGGELERHRADNLAFSPRMNLHFVGDYKTNALYVLDEKEYSDNGENITRMRASPHVSSGQKRLFCNSLQIDMETGVGLDGGVQGENPEAMLDYSDDGGHTWSSEILKSIGKIGEFKSRVVFRRLGQFRDRVFRLKITDKVTVTILGADIDISEGAN